MKFLQSITALGNDILIPIDKIKFVRFSYDYRDQEHKYVISIETDDVEIEEHYTNNEEKADKRFATIKRIIEAE